MKYSHYCSKDFILEGRRKPTYDRPMGVIVYLLGAVFVAFVMAYVLIGG